MKNFLFKITVMLVSVCLFIVLISFAAIICELVSQDFKEAWCWVIPFITSIIGGCYLFGISYYLYDEGYV